MIRCALLAPNARPLTPSTDKGVNETWKGRFLLLDGSSIEGYAKFIAGSQLISELLVNTLARLAGLNAPEPFIVRVDKADYLQEFANFGIANDSIVVFGTKALPGGSLARTWLEIGPDFLNQLLDKSGEWRRLAAFDTWVGNVDRHLKNLFYDGSKSGQLWLLDHGHCFGRPDWAEEDLDGRRNLTNRLLDDLYSLGYLSAERRRAVLDDAPAMQQLASLVDLEGAVEDSHVSDIAQPTTAQRLIQFLHYRSQNLVQLVAEKVGMPVLELDAR